MIREPVMKNAKKKNSLSLIVLAIVVLAVAIPFYFFALDSIDEATDRQANYYGGGQSEEARQAGSRKVSDEIEAQHQVALARIHVEVHGGDAGELVLKIRERESLLARIGEEKSAGKVAVLKHELDVLERKLWEVYSWKP